ncbi:hypothetical protein BH24ACT1_BH24ACT1_13230 [soil metagenome]
MDEGRVMPSAEKDMGEPAKGGGDEDIPDWTTWLRSRLERVSSSERTAAESAEAASQEVVGGDEQGVEDGGAEDEVLSVEGVGFEETLPVEDVAPKEASPIEGAGPEGPPAAPASPAAAMTPAPAPLPGPDSAFVVEIEALRAAVTALVAGVGALTDTFTGFRSVVNDRLSEYNGLEIGERLQRLAHGMEDLAKIRGELEDNRRLQATTNAELRQNDAEVSERLERLAEGMESLLAVRSDDERWAEVMGRLLDEVDAERHAGEREMLAAGGVIERLDGLEHALRRITEEVSEGLTRLPDVVDAERRAEEREALSDEKVVGRLDRLDQALRQVATDVAEVTAVQRSSADRAQASPRDNDADHLVRAMPAPDAAATRASSSPRKPSVRPPGRRATPLRAERPTAPFRSRPDIG